VLDDILGMAVLVVFALVWGLAKYPDATFRVLGWGWRLTKWCIILGFVIAAGAAVAGSGVVGLVIAGILIIVWAVGAGQAEQTEELRRLREDLRRRG
jgi:uncharacterized integral membrane protein